MSVDLTFQLSRLADFPAISRLGVSREGDDMTRVDLEVTQGDRTEVRGHLLILLSALCFFITILNVQSQCA